MAYGKMDKKAAPKDSMGGKPMSDKGKKLAALAGDKKKITKADVIAGAKMKAKKK